MIRLDTSLLRRNKNFRNLWLSGVVTGLGSFATYVAMPYQIARLTNSYVAVGLLGVTEVIPIIVFGLWGGVIADRFDRRTVVARTELTLLILSLTLLINSRFSHPRLWIIYVVSALFASVDGIQRPSLDAILPRVVKPEELAAASALRTLRGNIAHVVGPALGGILIAIGGVSIAYLFDALSFVMSVLFLLRISRLPTQRESFESPLRELRDAFGYLRTRKDIIGTYAIDTIAMICAFPYALFPFIVKEYNVPWALGFLYSSFAVGSLLATISSGWTSRIRRHGRAVVFSAVGWGVAILCAGLVKNIYWVLVFLVLAGAADMMSGLFRSLIWDLTIPDELRGRMAGLELLSYGIGPQVGQVRSTLTARWTSIQSSLVIGGAVCVGGVGVVQSALPALWSFEADTPQ
jgi:MFS family permease